MRKPQRIRTELWTEQYDILSDVTSFSMLISIINQFAEPVLNSQPNAYSFNPAMCTSQIQDMQRGFAMGRPYQLHEEQIEVNMNNPTYQEL